MIIHGDVLDILRLIDDESIDGCLTDPPYGLSKEPNMVEVLRHWLDGDDYQHTGGGFMGKAWDSFVPGPSVWREVYRVMKPGAHLLAFGGTRTYDLLVLAIRLAGFEIRDQLAWMYGTGFPKSKNVAMAIDKAEGIIGHRSKAAATAGGDLPPPDKTVGAYTPDGETVGAPWSGWGTALKPAHEPIVLARKPLIGTVAENVLELGTGAINVDACRVGSEALKQHGRSGDSFGFTSQEPPGRSWVGRWPANVLLDEAAAAQLDEQAGPRPGQQGQAKTDGSEQTRTVYSGGRNYRSGNPEPRGDSGGPSRFFYCAKASKAEREAGLEDLPVLTGGTLTDRKDGSQGLESPRAGAGRKGGRRNNHPTVKPIELLEYLGRLILQPGQTALVPFCGSGSEVIALERLGCDVIGIELEAEYVKIAEARVRHWCGK